MKHLPLPLPSRVLFLAIALLTALPYCASAQRHPVAQQQPAAEESPFQTLVSNDGVSIEAEILRIDGGNVFIRRRDGANFNFPLSMLDEKSRKMVQAWAVDHALANSLEVKVRERTIRREKNDTNSSTGTNKTVQLTFSFLNNSATPIDNLRLEYRIYVTRERLAAPNSDFTHEESISGKDLIKPIGPRQEQTVESDLIELVEQKLRGNFIPERGNNRSSQDKIGGYWYRIYRGKNLITEDASPRRLMRVKTW